VETSLHQQLKSHYAGRDCAVEARVDRFRIDVVRGKELIEVQHGSLAAIRDKVGRLLQTHAVRVVKPIVTRKRIVRLDCPDGRVVGRRLSPKRGRLLDLFDELVYFTRVYPHPRLVLEVPLVAIEEWRYPGHGRRRRWRKNDFVVADQKLTELVESHEFRTAADLGRLLPRGLPRPFDTGQLGVQLNVARWTAQRIAYTLRQVGTIEQAGKRGNALLYRRCRATKRRAA